MKATVKVFKLTVGSNGYEAIDLTENVKEVVLNSGLINGVTVVHTPSRYCSVTMIEYEPELLADLEEFISKCRGLSGIGEALIGKSVIVPVVNSELRLGTFKRVVWIDFSKVSGDKEVVVVLEGIFK